MSRRSLSRVTAFIFVSMLATSARAGTWGVSVGMSKPFDEYVHIGFRCGGEFFRDQMPHLALGVEGAFNLWIPSSNPGTSRVGVDWRASGLAYLFEVTPSVRITTARSDRDPRQFFVQMGAGATFISSNAEVEVSVPGYPGGWSGYDLDSQVAPSLVVGLGGRFLSGDAFGAVDLKYHGVFTEPVMTNYLSLSFGVAF